MRRNAIASDRITELYFDELQIEMRHIDAQEPNLNTRLYGMNFKTPIMTAALSHLKGSKNEDGMVQMAEGAGSCGSVNWVGMTTKRQFAEIMKAGCPTVRIIKPYKDEEEIISRIRQAEELGALAVGMDLDHALDGRGKAAEVLGMEMSPKTIDDLRRYCEMTKLPFIVKGVLSVIDAEKCLKAGVRGIVVSHHHGLMPSAVPPLAVLPQIKKMVGDAIPIFVDCSIANGADAFKALALGASAVCVGRPLIQPIMERGAEGAAGIIRDISGELAGVMARTACRTLQEIDASLIWKGGRPYRTEFSYCD